MTALSINPSFISIYLSKNYVHESDCNFKVYNKTGRNDDQCPTWNLSLSGQAYSIKRKKTVHKTQPFYTPVVHLGARGRFTGLPYPTDG